MIPILTACAAALVGRPVAAKLKAAEAARKRRRETGIGAIAKKEGEADEL
jgi:hypothetical protein